MTDMDAFIQTVSNSMLLTLAEKRELLADPSSLPEEYRTTIMSVINAHEERARILEQSVREQIKDAQYRWREEVRASNLSEATKQNLLAKAKKQFGGLFVSFSS